MDKKVKVLQKKTIGTEYGPLDYEIVCQDEDGYYVVNPTQDGEWEAEDLTAEEALNLIGVKKVTED
jgi:hypothetical protein